MSSTVIILFFLFATTVCMAKNLNTQQYPLSDEFIDEIRNKTNLWIPGRNFPADTPLEYLRKLGGGFFKPTLPDDPVITYNHLYADIPKSFDAREKWTNCRSLKEIRNQGVCGCCWAISSASAMTDRICIHSNQTKYFHVSTEQLTSCVYKYDGCQGGFPEDTFQYWIDKGVVSGGPYQSNEGCQPWTMTEKANPCQNKCTNPNYPISFEDDLNHDGTSWAYLGGERNYQIELMTNGPIVVLFPLYEDFYNYKSGVYKHVSGNFVVNHVIKIIGWGEENGTPYWLCANSWGTEKMDHGYFKFLRGEDHLGFEKKAVAGYINKIM